MFCSTLRERASQLTKLAEIHKHSRYLLACLKRYVLDLKDIVNCLGKKSGINFQKYYPTGHLWVVYKTVPVKLFVCCLVFVGVYLLDWLLHSLSEKKR